MEIDKLLFRKYVMLFSIIIFLILSILIVRPLFSVIVYSLILTYLLRPVYLFLGKFLKYKGLNAFIICLIISLVIFVPIIFLIPLFLKQIFNFYVQIQNINIVAIIQKVFPSLEPYMINKFVGIYNYTIAKATEVISNKLTEMAFNIPIIALEVVMIMILVFFGLRDWDLLMKYIKSFSPFKAEIEAKFIERIEAITASVIWGFIGLGVIEGLLTGVGFLIFGVKNTLILTIVAILFAILPIIGSWIVWVPVSLNLLITGNISSGIGLIVYCLFIIIMIEPIFRPLFIKKKVGMPSSIALVSMIGGWLTIGLVGFFVGPLIVGYLLLLLEFYKEKKVEEIFIVG